ncbi:MAG: hypothetical protein KC649_00660, partial [Candidatus Omnitrophica bacterium]|nr:hypothetical protein [Candidatus Omnitrophota bacterium]
DGKPFIVRGVCYNPIPVGKDYEYDFFSDPGKPWVADGKLMKEAGINAVRLYRVDKNPESVKKVISGLKNKFGIYSFVGHYLGFWDWPPANYSDANFRQKMMQDVLRTVETYKDQPGNIGWILGNENNYSFDRNIRDWSSEEIDAIKDPKKRWEEKARIYYSYVNELAVEVRKIDPTRPIIMGIGEVKSLEIAAQVTPDIDVIGVIAYRGAGFGNLFRTIQQTYDKPVLVIEYGADRFNAYTKEEDQTSQARFVELQWKDIERNSAIRTSKGNVIGGLLFEWTDEWWKANENLGHTWGIHDRTAQWSNSSYYYDYEAPGRMNINEEWFGIVALKQKPEEMDSGIDKRVPTSAYHRLKKYWKNEIVWNGIDIADDSESADDASLQTSADSASVLGETDSNDSNTAKIVSLTESVDEAVSDAPAPVMPAAEVPADFKSSITKNSSGGYNWNYMGFKNFSKGVVYNPAPVGQNYDYRMFLDPTKPWRVDGELMKKAGINSVKLMYSGAENAQNLKEMVHELYEDFGIQTVLVHDLNFWNSPQVNYGSPADQKMVMSNVEEMVSLLADEKGISAWVLGSQNNLSFDSGLRAWTTDEVNAYLDPTDQWKEKAKIYYSFINKIAEKVKGIDSHRPVVMGVDEIKSLGIAADLIPSVDAVGIASFRGNGIGDVIKEANNTTGKPVMIMEFGIDRFNALTSKEDQQAQADAIKIQIEQLQSLSSVHKGTGVLVGAFIYEWSDQWWKARPSVRSSWLIQDENAQSSNPDFAYDYSSSDQNLNVNEEWFGIVALKANPAVSADQRVPTLAYQTVKDMWTNSSWTITKNQ